MQVFDLNGLLFYNNNMTGNTEALKSMKAELERYGEFDIGPVARITRDLHDIINPVHQKILNDFLGSDAVYEPDGTRKKLLSIIDELLGAEHN